MWETKDQHCISVLSKMMVINSESFIHSGMNNMSNVTTSKLYCYVCNFKSDNEEWCESGISSIRRFHWRAQNIKFQIHMHNWECYHLRKHKTKHMLSEAAWISAFEHNQTVSCNGQYLDRLIQVISFLWKQELVLWGYDRNEQSVSKGINIETLELLAQEEMFIREN